MELPTIEVYSSIECPYAYLATCRLREILPEYAGKVQIVWRALALEYINREANPKPRHESEAAFLAAKVEPRLPARPWTRPDWEWPATLWPAFEALACAQAQGPEAASAMSWALRHALFAHSRCLALRHELFSVAQGLSPKAGLDLERFEDDWDSGRYKSAVIEECERGWHELKLAGSATFVLPDGSQVTNPGVGVVDYDEVNHFVRSYQPYSGNPFDAYRQMIEQAIAAEPVKHNGGNEEMPSQEPVQ